MNKFKNILFLITLILLSVMSCQKNELTGPLSGTYSGKVVRIGDFSANGARYIMSDTFEIYLKINNLKFRKFRSEITESCKGDVKIDGDKIIFDSDDCSCWCDCDPTIDCAGDIILGKYNFELNNDTLKMWSESIDSIGNFPVIVSIWSYEYGLIKQ